MPKTITQLPAATVVSGSAVVAADNATGTLTEKVTLSAIAGLASAGNTVVSSGGIAQLTSGEQAAIKEGTVVTTTDGRRWVYSGAGSKTSEASYVELSDISPDWSTLVNVPADFPPSAHTHTISDITDFPTTSTDGDVVTWDATAGAWVAEAPPGGTSYNQSLNTTDAVTFLSVSMDNGSSLSEGSFDNGLGGDFGISLNCTVGYELNWQAGHLACTADGGVTLTSIVCDSPIQFNGTGGNSVVVNGDQITFPDSTAQTTALPVASNHSDMLYWDGTNSVWATTPGNPGLMPTGSTTGDIIKWDSSLGYYVSAPSPVPTSASSNDILAWNGSAWAAVAPTTPGLPSGSQGQYLVKGSMDWQAGDAPVPTSATANNTLRWDANSNEWVARIFGSAYASQTGYSVGDVVVHDGVLYQANASGMGNTPPNTNYWDQLTSPVGIPPLQVPPNVGEVLTYTQQDGWIGQPASGGGLTATYARSTSDETSGSGMFSASTSLTAVVQSGETYQVDGLALLESDGTSQYAEFSLQLLALTSDGDVWFDCDIVDFSAGEVWAVAWNSSQTNVTAVGDSNGAFAGVIPIRFRGWVEVSSSVSSSNVRVMFGDTSANSSVILKAGSWMTVTKLS